MFLFLFLFIPKQPLTLHSLHLNALNERLLLTALRFEWKTFRESLTAVSLSLFLSFPCVVSLYYVRFTLLQDGVPASQMPEVPAAVRDCEAAVQLLSAFYSLRLPVRPSLFVPLPLGIFACLILHSRNREPRLRSSRKRFWTRTEITALLSLPLPLPRCCACGIPPEKYLLFH
jgi:hypothetical protein